MNSNYSKTRLESPSSKGGPLVIVGDGPIAEVAFEYFTHDSLFDVTAFSVEREFLTKDSFLNRPVAPFEDVERLYPPSKHKMFVALGYGQLNRLRARLHSAAKEKGYTLASYVSSNAFVWRNVQIGDNCFIFEDNVIQPFVKIGNNVTMWSGNHIGHHSNIGDHCFISSHVVVSGFVNIREYCFLGVNATLANNIEVKRNCLVGAGATILKDTEEAKIYGVEMTEAKQVSTVERFGISE